MRGRRSARIAQPAKSIMAGNSATSSVSSQKFPGLATPRHVLVPPSRKALVWDQIWDQIGNNSDPLPSGDIPPPVSGQFDDAAPPALSPTSMNNEPRRYPDAMSNPCDMLASFPVKSDRPETLVTIPLTAPLGMPYSGHTGSTLLLMSPGAAVIQRGVKSDAPPVEAFIPSLNASPLTAPRPRFIAPAMLNNAATLVRPRARYPPLPRFSLRPPTTWSPPIITASRPEQSCVGLQSCVPVVTQQSHPPLDQEIILPASDSFQLQDLVASFVPRPAIVPGPVHPSTAMATLIPELMSLKVSVSADMVRRSTRSTEEYVSPGAHTARPILRSLGRNLNGINISQIQCLTGNLVEVYVDRTEVFVWLPPNLSQNKPFMTCFLHQDVSYTTVLAFSKVLRLGYSVIPMMHYMSGLETFLSKLQRGDRTIAHLFCGRCPHSECLRYITNQDIGHHCLAMQGRLTDHHVGRVALGLPK